MVHLLEEEDFPQKIDVLWVGKSKPKAYSMYLNHPVDFPTKNDTIYPQITCHSSGIEVNCNCRMML